MDKLIVPEMGMLDVQQAINTWMTGIIVFVVVLIASEMILRTAEWWVARSTDAPRRLLPDNAVVNMVTNSIYHATMYGLGVGLIYVVSKWGYDHSHWRIPLTWWSIPLYFLAGEFIAYYFHRMMHEMRLFWADHSVHHSATEFDFTTAQRFHLLEWVPKVITHLPLAMIGFHPVLLIVFGQGAAIQLICHTARFGRWGLWDKVFCSPTIHAVHHARNPIYMDRNLGGGINFWDQVFGTYQEATNERMIFGVTHVLNSTNPIKVLFYEYTFLWRDFIHAPSLKDKLIVLFGRPGETFEVPALGHAPSGHAPSGRGPALAAPIGALEPA